MQVWKATILAAIILATAGIVGAIITTYAPFSNRTGTGPPSTSSSTLPSTVTSATTSIGNVLNVTGENIETAKNDTSRSGFVPYPVPFSDHEFQVVFKQFPPGGTRYPIGKVVELDYGAGNRSVAYPSVSLWGQGVGLGFTVTGKIVNAQNLNGSSLYLLLKTPSLISGVQFWVQNSPTLYANGTWTGRLSFGFTGLILGSSPDLFVILTTAQLTSGQSINAIPPDSTVYSVPLVYSG